MSATTDENYIITAADYEALGVQIQDDGSIVLPYRRATSSTLYTLSRSYAKQLGVGGESPAKDFSTKTPPRTICTDE